MKVNLFLAKSHPIETIQEHTDKLLTMYEQLKNLYYSDIKLLNWHLLYLACLHHDLGKINANFQNKLYKLINKKEKKEKYFLLDEKTDKEIPHGCLSASLINKEYLNQLTYEEKIILIWVVYYHHYRNTIEDITINERNEALDNSVKPYLHNFKYEKLNYDLEINYNIRRYLDEKPSIEDNEELYYQYVLTKGFLNKIDYAASSQLSHIEINDLNLLEKLIKFREKKNYTFNELQNYVSENQDKNLVVIASTGMGKTEAGLLWIGNRKGFFTLPLKVSINAIYNRILKDIDYENVGLLHSDTISEYINYSENEELDIDYYYKTIQLSLPLTVCTLDQIVDIVYKYPNYEHKLATFSYSKIIIDEIQMYSPDLLALLIVFLKQLTDVKGKFMIMTATLPEVFIYYIEKYKIPYFGPKEFICTDVRHKIKVINTAINTENIIKSYQNKKKKILIIVNTVKKAQEIFNELKNKEIKEINIFHARFIQKDRKEKSNEIFSFGQLENKQSGIWVTTQVVEASLDIDFDELHTELSDISGLIQRMGRVYRKRTLEEDKENIYVYVGEHYKDISGIGTVIDKEIYEISHKNIIEYDTKALTEQDKLDLVKKTYSYEILKNTKYFKKIGDVINSYLYLSDFIYDKSDINLRNIDTVTAIPIDVYKNNQKEIDELVEKLINIEISNFSEKQKLINKIKDYTLQIERRRFKIVDENVTYKTIELSKHLKIYIVNYEYDSLIGLKFNAYETETNNPHERMY